MFPVPYEEFSSTVVFFDHPFAFERNFNEEKAFQWMREHWTFSIWLSIFYIIFVFAGQKFMSNRPAYNLRPILAVWSGLLAAFSIFSSFRVLPAWLHIAYQHGLDHFACKPSGYFGDTGVYGWIFTLSKSFELGDTVFIVLRKKPLIFLHWYHHVTVFIYSCYTYGYYYAPGQYSVPMNIFVHSLMYTYYFLSAIKLKVPRTVNVCITVVQLSQMIIGIAVNIRSIMLLNSGHSCQLAYDHLGYSLAMYGSYAILFAHYFYMAYLSPRKQQGHQGALRKAVDEKHINNHIKTQ